MGRRSGATYSRSYYKMCAREWKNSENFNERFFRSFMGYVFAQTRTTLGFKQKEMGFLANGLSTTTISTFENGDIFKRIPTISAICYAYDIDTRFALGHTKIPMNYARTGVNESVHSIVQQLLA